MLVTSQLTIDLNYRDFNRYLYATQNDGNTRAVEITLLSDRSPWTIPAGVVGAVSFKKPDKTAGLYDTLPDGETQAVQVSGNKLTAILAPQVLTVTGDVFVSIVLFDKALNRLGTFPFTLRVAADPSGGQSVSNDYYAFKTLAELNAAILEHTENKNNPHGVTFEQIGAAPAGYGLGGQPTKTIRSVAELDNLNEFGLYNFDVHGTRINNIDFGYATVLVYPFSTDIWVQEIRPLLMTCVLKRYRYGSTYDEWCVDNPPMIPGVEYRTTERRDGKVVYATAYSIGGLAGKGSYGGSSPYSGKVFECHGLYVGSDGKYYSGIEQDGWVSLYVTGDNYIQCRNNVDWHTHSNVIVTLKYTKD